MAGPLVLIFHRHAADDEPPLLQLLADVRQRLAEQQAALFRRAGAGEIRLVEGSAAPFGSQLAAAAPAKGGVIVLGSGAVPRLGPGDARQLAETAAAGGRRALTNNRYSSDVCAISDASALRGLPLLPSDNALPRWLEEHAGFTVADLAGRDRLALDIDTILDVCLWALAPGSPAWVRALGKHHHLAVPRLADLRALAADPHAELLVFGRTGSATLRWLERHVRCRVRLLAEERGLRASSPLAIGTPAPKWRRQPRATLGMLLEAGGGASALADIVAELADGAIIDSRVLFAHRYGTDEAAWPSAADRMASDLLRGAEVRHRWLRSLTESATVSRAPILLGAHSLVGPGVRLLLRGVR